MAQMSAALFDERFEQILCGYVNTTRQIQILRIANPISSWFERVIFPGQRILFFALPITYLEIYSSEIPSTVLMDKILCDRLRINS